MKCSQTTTWLPFYSGECCSATSPSLYTLVLACRTLCTINQNNQKTHSVLVYHKLRTGVVFLYVALYNVSGIYSTLYLCCCGLAGELRVRPALF